MLRKIACAFVAPFFFIAVTQAEETSVPDVKLIQSEVAKNWNVVPELAQECPEPFRLNITLESGGVVKEVVLDGEERTGACNALVQAGRRAVMLSSPLPVPTDLTGIKLDFDPARALGLTQ